MGWGLLVYPIPLLSLPLSGRSHDMTEILLSGTLSLTSIKSFKTCADQWEDKQEVWGEVFGTKQIHVYKIPEVSF